MQTVETKPSVWLITGTLYNIGSSYYPHKSNSLGATSGFGKRIVYSSLARGDRVIATGRTAEKIGQLVSNVKPELVDNLRTVLLDVAEGEESIKVKIDGAAAFWGHIDVLVSNAGQAFIDFMGRSSLTLLIRCWDSGFI